MRPRRYALAAAPLLLNTAARGDGENRPEKRSSQIDPQAVEPPRHERGSERPGGVHRRAGNRSGEKGFKPYDRAHGNARHDAFLLRSRRHAQDYEHQNECQNRFQNKRLNGSARRNGCPERDILRKQNPQGRAGNYCSRELTGEVRQHKPAGKAPRDKETERDSRVKMTSRNVAQRVNHRQHDQAKGQRDSDVRNRAPGFHIDNDCPRTGKDKRESSKRFGG